MPSFRLNLCSPLHCITGGDAAILSAAFFFSLATVRLGTYARHIPSVELAAAKSVVLGTAAVATFGLAAASMLAAGDPLTDLWPGFDNPLAWGILVYSALGPGAGARRSVPPPRRPPRLAGLPGCGGCARRRPAPTP